MFDKNSVVVVRTPFAQPRLSFPLSCQSIRWLFSFGLQEKKHLHCIVYSATRTNYNT